MAHNNKRIISNSLSMYFRMILVTMVTLYTSRIVLEQLGIIDFGIYNAVGGVVLFFSFIVPTLSSSVQRFLNYEIGRGNEEKVNAVFSMSVIVHFLMALLLVFLGETIGLWFLNTQMNIPANRIYVANVVLQCAIVSLVTILIGIPYNALIIAKQRMNIYAFFSIITALLKLLTAFLLTIVSIDKLGVYAVMLMFIYIVARLNVGLYCKFKFKDVRFCWLWDMSLFKQLFSFSGWTLYGNTGKMAYTYGLNLVLNIFCGPAVNAARAISVQIQHAVHQFTNSFQTAINPQITQSYAANDCNYVEQLLLSSVKGTIVLLVIIIIPMVFEMDFILHIWLGVFPPYTVSLARLVMIICFIDALTNPSRILIQSTGRISRFQIVQGTVLILVLPLSCTALSMGCGPESVYVLTILLMSITTMWGYRIMFSQIKYLHSSYLINIIGLASLCCLPSLLLAYCLHKFLDMGFVRLVLVTLLPMIVLILLSFFVLTTQNEKKILMDMLNVFKRKSVHKNRSI